MGSRQSLMPREHGAYAQIAFPLMTALALGAFSPAPILLLVAIICIFLAHEPAMVLTGGRGGRARRETGGQARRRAILLAAISLATGAAGLWLAPAAAHLATLIPLSLGVLLIPLIFTRREKTAVGELLVATTLSSTMIPVAIAGGASIQVTLGAAAVWAIAFALGTLTVRAIIARTKRTAESQWPTWIAPTLCAAVIILAIAAALTSDLPALAVVAVVPTALVALIFALMGIHPRNLRRMGWSLVASNVAVLAGLIIGLV